MHLWLAASGGPRCRGRRKRTTTRCLPRGSSDLTFSSRGFETLASGGGALGASRLGGAVK
eukprot:866807-Alexandrium_andersonii.AAC.1